MQIIDKILNILHSISGIETVIHDTSFSVNVRLDRQSTPASILYMLNEFSVDTTKGIRRESAEIEIFFCDRVDLAAKGEVVQQKLDTLLPYVNQFIASVLNEKTLIVESETVNVKCAIGRFDCNVCGWSLEMKIAERQATCFDSDTSGVNQIVIKKNGTVDVAAYGEALVNVVDGEILLQNKTATTNGIVTFDDGYNGLQSVTVNVQAPAPVIRLQEKTTNTNGYVTFDNGYNGLQGVTVNVPQPTGTLQRTISENGTETVDIANYQAIEITTNVPTQTCDLYTGLTVEANGVYNPATYNKDGFSTFVVNIPQPQGTLQRTISTNGTQTYDVSLWENIEITTNVPTQTCNLYTGLSITQNGTYNPSQYGDYDGFGSISVNVQPQNVGTATLNAFDIAETRTMTAQDFGYNYLTGVDTTNISIGESVYITENHGWFDAQQFGFDLIRSFQVEVPPEQVCHGTLPVTISNAGVETVNCCGYDIVSIDTSQIQGYNTWKGTWAQYQAIFPKDPDTLYLITD